MTKTEYNAALEAIGHFRGAVVRKANGTGFYGACECGYQSVTRMTIPLAVEAIQHHRKKALALHRANGVSVPRSAGVRL